MVQTPIAPQNLYPDSDGQPMADKTIQYRWITKLVTNLKHLLRDQTAFALGEEKVTTERDKAWAKLRELGINPEDL